MDTVSASGFVTGNYKRRIIGVRDILADILKKASIENIASLKCSRGDNGLCIISVDTDKNILDRWSKDTLTSVMYALFISNANPCSVEWNESGASLLKQINGTYIKPGVDEDILNGIHGVRHI